MELLTAENIKNAFTYNFLSVTVISFSLLIAIFAFNWKVLLIAAAAFPIVEQVVLFSIAFAIFGFSWKNSFGIFTGPAGAISVTIAALTFAAYLFWCSLFFAIKQVIRGALQKSRIKN